MKNKLSKILALFLLAITLTGCDDSPVDYDWC